MKYWFIVLMSLVVVLSSSFAHAKTIHIVALGASGTYGKNLMRESAYPAQLEKMLKEEGFDATVKNAGVNGSTTGDMLMRLDYDVPAGTDIVIFTSTRNDNKKSSKLTDTKYNIKTIAERLLDKNIKVIFLGGHKQQEYLEDCDALTLGNINELGENELQIDNEHLTPSGYRKVAEKILPIVKSLIAEINVK